MGAILQTIEKLNGGKCYQTERFTLDHFENPAIAKIQTTMMAMEVELIREMVHSHTLRLDQYEDLNRLQLNEAQVIILTNPRDRFKRH